MHLIRRQIGYRYELLRSHHATERGIRASSVGLAHELGQRSRHVMDRDSMEVLTIIRPQTTECGLAKTDGLVEHRIEHRREVAGRAVDDLQHLGGRGLLLQGLARLGEQPDVLNRNNRLVGEGLEQVDLRLRKRHDLAPRYGDRADRIAVLQDRHRQHGMHPSLADGRQRVFGVRGCIGDMRDLPRQDRACRRALPAGRDREVTLDGLQHIRWPPVMCNKMDQRTIEPEYAARLSAR